METETTSAAEGIGVTRRVFAVQRIWTKGGNWPDKLQFDGAVQVCPTSSAMSAMEESLSDSDWDACRSLLHVLDIADLAESDDVADFLTSHRKDGRFVASGRILLDRAPGQTLSFHEELELRMSVLASVEAPLESVGADLLAWRAERKARIDRNIEQARRFGSGFGSGDLSDVVPF